MTSRDFVYWLQGYFELNGASVLTESQAQCIQKHLALVFKHEIDPSAGPPEHQAELDAIHGGLVCSRCGCATDVLNHGSDRSGPGLCRKCAVTNQVQIGGVDLLPPGVNFRC